MKRIFLLGGYDLEMKVIKELLIQAKEVCFDKHLKWDNAALSMYQDILDEYGNNDQITIYGLELRFTDNEKYSNYILIDHHNEYNTKPSTLLQVAEILDQPLNRYQQLVVANDSNYIPGMEQLGATRAEINDIRFQDRQAQGVTIEDERLAEYAIQNNMDKYGDLTVVKSDTPRFSTITDRLYPYNSLLIYNEYELMFYGKGVPQVIHLFTKELTKENFFYGGGENGFAGIVANAYNYEDLQHIKVQIINLINYENI